LAAQHQRRSDELVGERLMGTAHHVLGDQTSARQHIEQMLTSFIASEPAQRGAIRVPFDQGAWARIFLARILWLQGFPDQAVRTAERAVDEARDTNHAISLRTALVTAACPIMLWVGDLAAAEHYIAMLLDHSARLALSSWGTRGRIIQSLCVVTREKMRGG
jgi:Tetratricopeptide repeat